MDNLLVDLWHGEVHPSERSGADDPEIKNLVRLIEENRIRLGKALDASGKERLCAFSDCYSEYTDLVAEHAFCDGFRLACRILTAALGTAESYA